MAVESYSRPRKLRASIAFSLSFPGCGGVSETGCAIVRRRTTDADHRPGIDGIRSEIWARLVDLAESGFAILVIDKDLKALSRLAQNHYVSKKAKSFGRGRAKC
jgi:hypothetical protein